VRLDRAREKMGDVPLESNLMVGNERQGRPPTGLQLVRRAGERQRDRIRRNAGISQACRRDYRSR
jgi:hypothetical protein